MSKEVLVKEITDPKDASVIWDELRQLGDAAVAESRWNKYSIDYKKWHMWLEYAVNDPEAILIVAIADNKCVGMLFASLSEHHWLNAYIATEHLFYIDKSYRNAYTAKRMLWQYEQFARTAGCDMMLVGNSAGIKTKKLLRFLQLLGFKMYDIEVRKDLKDGRQTT